MNVANGTNSLAVLDLVPTLLALLLVNGIAGCAPDREDPARRPDILFVILDTLRADHVSSYGYPQPTTPQLDAVAEAGALFEDVTAPAPWTWPSHASIFTGEPPWIHGAHSAPDFDTGNRVEDAASIDALGIRVTAMREDLPTLAERLEGAGYYSAAVATNDWLAESLGLTRGFSRVQIFDRDSGVIDAARDQINHSPDRPLFLFVNLLSAHLPYREGPGIWSLDEPAFFDPSTAPEWARPYLRIEKQPFGIDLNAMGANGEKVGIERYLSGELAIPEHGLQTLRDLYDASVRAADFSFGRILEAWTARFPEGIVIVASDHGEAFGEHQLLEHRHAVYPEEVSVPLVLAAPLRIAAGQRIAVPVRLESIYATILELAGVERTAGSLLRFVVGFDAAGTRLTPSTDRLQPIHSVVWPNQGLSQRIGGRFAKLWYLYREDDRAVIMSDAGDIEFYDLGSDPGMRNDLSAEATTRFDTDLQRRARSALRAVQIEAHSQAEANSRAPIELDHQMRQRLQSLGYGS